MAFPDPPIARHGEGRPLLPLKVGDPIQPFRHQIGGEIGKVVSAKRSGRIGLKIDQPQKRADIDNIFYFVLDILHLKTEGLRWAVLCMITGRISRAFRRNTRPDILTIFGTKKNPFFCGPGYPAIGQYFSGVSATKLYIKAS